MLASLARSFWSFKPDTGEAFPAAKRRVRELLRSHFSMDFLGLDSKGKDVDVPIEHLDYGYVEECKDPEELLAILRVLQSGKEGRYYELEAFVEQRMLAVMSPADKKKYLALTTEPSREDVGAASSDVATFISSVKAADAELGSSRGSDSGLPPPRSAAGATLAASAAPKPMGTADSSAPKRVDWKSGDLGKFYERWGKFDVDKVRCGRCTSPAAHSKRARTPPPHTAWLQALEETGSTPEMDEAELKRREAARQAALAKLKMKDPAGMPSAARVAAANNEKAKGNDAFRAKEYSDAVTYYSRSLQYVPGSPVVLCNRAMAHLKKSAWAEAEADCDAALAADATLLKAWVRRGTARSKQGKYAGAMGDLHRASQLAPDKAEVAKLLRQAKAKFSEVEGKEARKTLEEHGVEGVLEAIKQGKPWGRGTQSGHATDTAAPVQGATGYTRVAIQEDSDDSDGEAADKPAGSPYLDEAGGALESKSSEPDLAPSQSEPAKPPAPVASTGFTRVSIEEVDSDDSEMEDEPQAAPAPPPAPEVVAAEAKVRGNRAFASGNLQAAVEAYTQSLAAVPLQPAVHSNRALVHIKLAQPDAALTDCSAGLHQLKYAAGCAAEQLRIPPAAAEAQAAGGKPAPSAAALAVKLLFRQALAFKATGALRKALACLAEVLRLEPVNSRAQTEMSSIEAELASQAASPSRPAATPPPSAAQQSPARPKIEEVSTPGISAAAAVASGTPSRPTASAGEGGPRASPSSVVSPGRTEAEQAAAAAAARVVASKSADSLLPEAPKSTYELETAVNSLRGRDEVFGKYLLSLTPKKLKKQLHRAPEPDTMSALLQVVQSQLVPIRPKFSVNLVKALGDVPGFSTTSLMLGKQDRAIVQEVVAAGQAAGSKPEALAKVRKAYGL